MPEPSEGLLKFERSINKGRLMKAHNGKKGLTLIEVMLALLIVGILAVVAVPIFMNLSQKARENQEKYVVNAVRTGLEIYRVEQAVQ